MKRILAGRFIHILMVLVGITFVTFVIVQISPGDPVTTLFPPEVLGRIDQARLREQMGLNAPLPIQYTRMIGQFLKGSLTSFHERRPTLDLIAERFPTTLTLSGLSLFLALIIGIPLALLSATKRGSVPDSMVTLGAITGLSLPQFWLALLLILVFSEQLRWLPASGIRPIGSDSYHIAQMLPYMVMPTTVLTIALLPWIVRFTRTGLLEVINQDYVRAARSKGMPERRVILTHVLRNALIPLIAFTGTVFPLLLSGAVVVETIFGLPGIGRLGLRAAQNRDFPLLLTINMYSAILVLLSGALTDMLYVYFDPRIRFR